MFNLKLALASYCGLAQTPRHHNLVLVVTMYHGLAWTMKDHNLAREAAR
jgi:hypothetical protein